MNILDRLALISECKDVLVDTYGVDGNAICIISTCRKAMRDAGIPVRARDAFAKEATSGDYENVLKTADLWLTLVHIIPTAERNRSFISSLRAAGLDPEIQA